MHVFKINNENLMSNFFLIFIFLPVFLSCSLNTVKSQTNTCNEIKNLYNGLIRSYHLGNPVYSSKYPVTQYANGSTSRIVINDEINRIRNILNILPESYSLSDSSFTLTKEYLTKVKEWLIKQNCVSEKKNTYIIFNSDTLNRIDQNGKRQGEWVNFDQKMKTIIAKGYFIDDLKSGIFTKYYETGEIYKTVQYSKDTKIENTSRSFFKSGKLMSEQVLDSLNNSSVVYYNKEGNRITEFSIVDEIIPEFELLGVQFF
jgi:antitoxin component YwqK of YwqJK toxin-antitoxin module